MINTLETSIKLRSSGFPEKQAKALTEVIANNESIEIKRINKKIDVLDNNIKDLQKSVDYKFEKVDEKFEKVDYKFEKLDNNIKELQKSVDHKFEKVDEKLEKLNSKIDNVVIQLDSKIEKFRTEFTSQSRWMIGLMITIIIAIGILKFI